MRLEPSRMVWCDDAAVGILVPSGPAGGSWVLTNADHVVALVVVWGCCFGGRETATTLTAVVCSLNRTTARLMLTSVRRILATTMRSVSTSTTPSIARADPAGPAGVSTQAMLP